MTTAAAATSPLEGIVLAELALGRITIEEARELLATVGITLNGK